LTPIRDAISSVLRARGLAAAAALAEITSVWQRTVGEEVAKQVVPVALRAGELVCEAADQAWATEMRLLSDAVLARLADELGHAVAARCTVRVRSRSTQ
jgi:predicted nucleic acid-binding Zn ribbon protein